MEDNKDNSIYKRFVGGLDLDTNLSDVDKSDFIDGYDIVNINPKSRNDNNLLQPCSNTNFAYDLGEATATRKKYRVSMNLTGLASCNLLFNFNIKGLVNGSSPIAYTLGTNAAATLVLIQNAFPDEIIDTVTVSGFILVFDIQFTNLGYTDYFLTVSNSLGGTYGCETRLDAISVDKVGVFYPSCFTNVNNDQQIFATTNTNKPQSFTVTVNTTGTGLRLIFPTDPLIANGEEVYIYSTTGGINQVSAICTITKTTGTTYEVVGVITTPIVASGTYTVIRYYRSLSVIGYASKNDILDQWTYTELLRSNKLNFRLYKQIQGALDVTSDGLIYNFTDFLNKIKRLIYKGDITDGGFLTTYNEDALYSLDSLEDESPLQLGSNTAKVTITVAGGGSAGGRIGYAIGSKPEACYAVFCAFVTSDGISTTYSKSSNVLWLRSSSVYGHNYGINSGRALEIKVEQIPFELFEFIQIGIIEFTETSFKGYSLPNIQLNGEDTIYISDDGFNKGSYIDFNNASVLLEQLPFVFENAKSILNYNNYIIAANVNLYREYDLTNWAQKTIKLEVKRREITIGEYNSAVDPDNAYVYMLAGINDYSKCSNEWMSYMPHDEYRIGIEIEWNNGTPSSTYWIKDVSFAPSDTGLTDDVCCIVGGTDLGVYQYYIEATGIDFSYVLPNGKLLKDEVKDFRFCRALCNPSVQTTGLGIAIFLNGSQYRVAGLNSNDSGTLIDTRLAIYSPDYENTQNLFNWQQGDILISTQAWLGLDALYGTLNYGYTFNRNAGVQETLGINQLLNASTSSINDIAWFKYNNSGVIHIRGGAAIELSGSLDYSNVTNGYNCQNFYYIRPYGTDGAYTSPPQQYRFFTIPQDKWYNKDTHDNSTAYEIYGGDAFPTVSAYKTAENASNQDEGNTVVSFYSFNRTNTALRSGRFPYYTLEDYLRNPYLVEPIYEGDNYTYNAAFTPRYPFQNSPSFNSLLPQITNKFSSIYYSGIGFGSDNAGGNRAWIPLDGKDLETQYGSITHIDVLFGLNSENILMVWQERRFTAQYFNNTANIKSNSGELLMGNGEILGRQGQDLSEFGCEQKWLIQKGKNNTGKDLAFWICFRKTAIMRFGADGTSNIIGNIAYLVENKTVLALNNGYNNEDEPAFFNGCHAVWDNKRMEYIATLRLYPKCIPFSQAEAQKGDFKASPTLTWGFEQFPVIYKSLKDTNDDPVTDPTAWTKYEGYDSEYFEVLTLVWSEIDNKFKAYRSHSPKIYGQFNDTVVSSHPVYGNLIYEHNYPLNEALYYATNTTTSVTATTDPETFRINGTGIQSTFPSPFAPKDRQKYIVRIENKNYEIVDIGTNYLQMANIDSDDILPQVTITNFSYSVVNSQDPYIEGVANETKPVFVEYGLVTVQNNEPLKGMRFIAGLNSLSNQTVESNVGKARDEDYYQGTTNQQIPSPTMPIRSMLQGYWMKLKLIWRWGKKNKVEGIIINHSKVDKQI